ncbi:hypothetical protein SELMODRAFT_427167 [Selaginella moellendorffii]|uniref:GIL1/IRKI C-terminal domain-containing protein n=1 Tax=Selaginella moellendorffii TaxID=88036 RepID=D8SYR1_SELML|nr:uncharacterized protein LOC9638037 [Selaginella moellendorffii]EFJ10496.1 hypothetical protein SELMODRAFT_427167 [Selaginella moellendorffii]|eukprot:XP_002988406.1 uncharacterized protein LOC9638037 [Selaginella moellendorffii]
MKLMDPANLLTTARSSTLDDGEENSTRKEKVALRILLHMREEEDTAMAERFSVSSTKQLPTIAEEIPVSPSAKNQQQQRRRVAASSKSSTSEDDEMQANFEKLCTRATGCRPLIGILSSIIACGNRATSPVPAARSEHSSSPVTNSRTIRLRQQPTQELLELSKRQQSALVDKQDTIDMLEWQLEQLQSVAMKEREITGICCRHKGSPLLVRQRNHSKETLTTEGNGEECCVLSEKRVGGAIKSREGNTTLPPRRSSSPAVDHVSMDMEITATELLLEMTVVRATLAIRKFCKVFMKQMEMSGYSVLRALGDLEPRTVFAKKEHTAFALESRINKALFHCFENESFDHFGITKILNPSQRALARLEEFQRMKLLDIADAVNPAHANFEPDFLNFCENKTHDMWGLFPWTIIFKTTAERNCFTSAFINACKGVWLLHRLAYSMNPAAGIIRVGRGMDVNPVYVEPVVHPASPCKSCKKSKLEFMVMPGFRTQKKAVKCSVYVHFECK